MESAEHKEVNDDSETPEYFQLRPEVEKA